MVLDISNESFRNIFQDERLYLPIRWNGNDFADTLEDLFHVYTSKLDTLREQGYHNTEPIHADLKDIKIVCGLLIKAIRYYLNGFPSKSYTTFQRVMKLLMRTPLKMYYKSVSEQFESPRGHFYSDYSLKLYRVVSVTDNRPYDRSRVFHTPYNLRSKVSTNRYSIAGYPSLYLGTSLELCCEEIHRDPHKDFSLASLFELERNCDYINTEVQVIELGVKPQDFLNVARNDESYGRHISQSLLGQEEVRSAYLLWYPLIAACSYIRTNKNDPFAAEYIIPQLLMQWVRSEIVMGNKEEYDQLIGIRYFSCASIRASDMGFNYVFPTSGQMKSTEQPYCAVLAKAFRVSKPVYIHEYEDVRSCEATLMRTRDLDFI